MKKGPITIRVSNLARQLETLEAGSETFPPEVREGCLWVIETLRRVYGIEQAARKSVDGRKEDGEGNYTREQ